MSTSRPAAKKVSLADIARRAGVSTNTVSRVVRGDPEVSEKTRAHCEARRGAGLRAQLRGASARSQAHQRPAGRPGRPHVPRTRARAAVDPQRLGAGRIPRVPVLRVRAGRAAAQRLRSLRRRRRHHPGRPGPDDRRCD
nr:LacI family DNA-binding transcriptional regulator [Schaalia odontolytica]